MAQILIVEDESSIRQVISLHLSLAGHVCREAEDAAAARALLSRQRPDLALLDILLPGEDGFSLGRSLLEEGIPVLFVTARTALADRVYGLKLGADDYILKPFEPEELLARVENTLKRRVGKFSRYEARGLAVDFAARTVTLKGRNVGLTGMEFDLLATLIRHKDEAVSREALLTQVWGYTYLGQTHTVDVHVQRLRRKIGFDWIETVYKYGYRFQEREIR